MLPPPAEMVTATGAAMSVWCRFSGFMGGAEATLGTAGPIFAVWRMAGGVSLGPLAAEIVVRYVATGAGGACIAGRFNLDRSRPR